MARYEDDYDLEFLAKCTDEELELLFNILVFDKDGKRRNTEELSKGKGYRRFGKNYSMYWEEIAGELQHYGGNTIANKLRGHGVEYEELLDDVIKTLKIDDEDLDFVEEKENALIEYVFAEMVSGMDTATKMQLARELDLKTVEFSKGAMMIAAQGIIRVGGVGLTRLATYIAGYITRTFLGKVAVAGAGRVIGAFMGPVGWAITGVWTIADIASPAMRVTIPATVVVSCLRKIVTEREKNKDYRFVKCPECGTNLRYRKDVSKIKCPECDEIISV